MRCVYRSFDHTEAEIAAGLLCAQGCAAFVFENGLSRLSWPHVIAFGGARVVVADADRDAALDILARWNKGEYALPESEAAHDAWQCPRCRGNDVQSDDRYRGWAFAIAYLTGLPLLWPTWRERCRSCGFRWKAAPRQTHAALASSLAPPGSGS